MFLCVYVWQWSADLSSGVPRVVVHAQVYILLVLIFWKGVKGSPENKTNAGEKKKKQQLGGCFGSFLWRPYRKKIQQQIPSGYES